MRFLRNHRPFSLAGLLLAAAISLAGCKETTPEERLQEAAQLLQENQTSLAVLKLKDLVAEQPDAEASVEARFLLAQVYARLGRADNLQKALEQVDAVYKQYGVQEPRGFQAFQMMTELHLALGEFDKALALMNEGVDKATEPEHKNQLQMMRASLMLNAKDNAELEQQAIDYLRETMLNAEQPELRGQARELLANHYRQTGRIAESNEAYTAYIEKYPDEDVIPQLEMAKALGLKSLGEEEAAESLFEKGAGTIRSQIEEELDLNKRVLIQSDLARMYMAFGKPEKAEEIYRQIMQENTGSRNAINAQFAIGQLYLQTEQLDKATEHFEQMQRENPGSQIGMQAEQMVQRIQMYREQMAQQEAEAAAAAKGETPAAEPAEPAEPGTEENEAPAEETQP
jgi:tetratricopeptide (TPR) repeat protein